MIPLLDTLSHAGRIIGAINTVVPVTKADGEIELYGDNTDWIGIQRAILGRSIRKWTTSDVGLIIGAGGTARAAIYALHQLGLGKILIYNRTHETAKTVIAGFPISFNIHVVEDLKDLEKESPAIVVGTVPPPPRLQMPRVKDSSSQIQSSVSRKEALSWIWPIDLTRLPFWSSRGRYQVYCGSKCQGWKSCWNRDMGNFGCRFISGGNSDRN